MRATALLSLLVVALPAAAGPRVVGDHEVKAGGFAKLAIEGAGKTVLWDVKPTPIQEDEIAGVLVFTGVAGTEYTATAIVIDFDKRSAEKVKHVVRFGGPVPPTPPPPPPGPTPVPPPDPKPADPPIAGDGLRMLVVWETKDLPSYGSGQVQSMTAAEVRDYLRRKCPKGPNGQPEFRIFDKDDDVSEESLTWRVAFNRATKGGPKLPRLLVSNGKTGYEGDLPNSTAELMAILEKYGGD